MSEAFAPSPYLERRNRIETYFDRTAIDAWTQLTSDAPVSKIRETVRAGRDRMRNILLSRLPQDLHGARVLDAGCGSGALSFEAARRGAHVVGVDISEKLIELAQDRLPSDVDPAQVTFLAGDMLDEAHGRFDYAVFMDSLIHYEPDDAVQALERLAPRVSRAIQFTHAPRTAALSVMHAVGRIFPRGDRAPAITPMGEAALKRRLARMPTLRSWAVGRSERVMSGFYTSQAVEICAP